MISDSNRRSRKLTSLLLVALVPALAAGKARGQKTVPPSASARRSQASPRPTSGANLALTRARWHVLGARPLGMYYYTDDARALDSLRKNAAVMALLGPQSFRLDADGIVRGEIPPEALQAAREADLPVMPLLINPGFDRAIAHAVLRSPRAQERVVAYLAYLANRDNYLGWQLDLEFIDPADKALYTQFVARLAARLHRDRRLVSVAVVPRFSDAPSGADPTGEFHTGEWGAPYDFRALGRLADFLTLMTYDHHGSEGPPGPVAGHAWAEAAVRYAVARVPRSKLLLGIPFYGREWIQSGSATTSRSLGFKDIWNLLQQHQADPQWDSRWRTPWIEYRDASGVHTAWYEDRRSLGEKLKLLQQFQLRGFAAWRLGVEDPEFWPLAESLRKKAAPRPGGHAKPRERVTAGR